MQSVNLNYKVIGEGDQVIVILHGLFGMLDNWQTIAKRLVESGYKVYLVDQRDHGKSPSTDQFNYQILADDLWAFLDDHELYKVKLIGHSMGGKTTMQFAFDHPFYIEKMVIVDIWNRAYKGGHEEIFNAINALDVQQIDNRNIVYDYLMSHNLDEGTVQFLLKNLQRRPEGGYEWKMNYKLLSSSYSSILDKVGDNGMKCDVDTLFIKGGASNYIKPSDFETIRKQFTNCTIIEIAEAGHWVHAEKPAELLDVITDFFIH